MQSKIRICAAFTSIALMFCARPIAAHHSTAHIDHERTVEIRGRVLEYQYTNPHVHLIIEGVDASGESAQWTFEMQSPNWLSRHGWHRDSWAPGDAIIAVGNPSRIPGSTLADGLRFANAGGEILETTSVDEAAVEGLTLLPVMPDELVRIPAERMDGIWELGHVDGRVGRPPVVYELPSPDLRERFPRAHPAMWPYLHVLNETSRAALNSFDNKALDNPWCTPEPFFLQHFVEPVLMNIVLEDERVTFEKPGEEFIVHIGGKHPPIDQQFDYGYAIGEWDGDTLNINIANFAPNPWGLGRGLPSSSQKTVQHRISWAEDKTMLYMSTTIFDPEYMTDSFMMQSRWAHSPHRELLDYAECSEESANNYIEDEL